jgi:outer membrane protein assembly factor BamB
MCDERNTSRWPRRRYLQTTATAGIATVAGLHSTDTARADPGELRFRVETSLPPAGSPTVVDGMVFTVSGRSTLQALDARTGDRRWSFDAINPNATPTVVDGTVYAASTDLYAVDTKLGSLQWCFEGSGSFVGSPTVSDGTVYAGSRDGRLYAVDAGTGSELWRFETGHRRWSSPAVVDGTLYVASGSETTDEGASSQFETTTLYAVDTETADTEWRVDIKGIPDSAPTVANGTVYIGSGAPDDAVLALDAATGDEVWRFESTWLGGCSPTVADGMVYVGGPNSGDGGSLYALEAGTGDLAWQFETEDRIVRSSPTVADGVVYVGVTDGSLRAVDTATETERWSFQTEETRQVTAPIVVDGVVYVSSRSALYAVDTAIEGSSEGSRTRLGTLGHHDEWDHADQQIQIHREANYTLDGVDWGVLGLFGVVTGGIASLAEPLYGTTPTIDAEADEESVR